jgi:hypothetical protein
LNHRRSGVIPALFVAGVISTTLSTIAAFAGPNVHGPVATVAQASAAPPAPAVSAPAAPVLAPAPPAADFGTPPSGEIPIIFNDHHVYAKPDRLMGGRVLTAIVRSNVILVPMRSLFEQLGATVSYDSQSKTVDVTRAGADVKVTVGRPEVFINGESRPLDVPPILLRGNVLVPLRVLSEGMGAYVQWVPDRHVVVVRYVSAPVPSPPPEAPPPAPPTATPVPAATPLPVASAPPAPRVKEAFVVGDYIFSPKIYDEVSPGNKGYDSFRLAGAVEFELFNLPWMLEGDFRSFRNDHAGGSGVCPSGDQSCVTGIGSQGQVYAPAFQARNDDFDGRFGLKIADPRVYIGVGFLVRNTNYEGGVLPTQEHGFGFGVDKLPDLDEPFSLYGSIFYFPIVTTNASQDLGGGSFGEVKYRVIRYAVGATYDFGDSPIYLDLGYLGEHASALENAPVAQQFSGPYAGFGIHF